MTETVSCDGLSRLRCALRLGALRVRVIFGHVCWSVADLVASNIVTLSSCT